MGDLKGYPFHRNLHAFSFEGQAIVLDVPSGSVHLLDQLAWEALETLRAAQGDWEEARRQLAVKHGEDRAREVLGELAALQAEGTLFTSDEELVGYRPPQEPILKALCLHVAHDCNMTCRYCFASTGHFGGERELMPLEIGQAAIDFLLARSGPRRRCEIDFFGGEPLMNFPVVKELVAYGRKKAQEAGKEIKFTLTTNALLLDQETGDYLNRENISLVLSLDGRPQVNDGNRATRGGHPTYERVLPNIRAMVDSRRGQEYYVRGTFTRHNLDFGQDVLHLADLGFDQVSVEPVVAAPEEEYALRTEDIPRLEAEYEALAREYRRREREGRGFSFFHFNLDLNHGPCLPRRLSGCGAGHEYLAVAPSGDLYPCHQFVGREQYRLGHVREGDLNRELSRRFQEAHVFNKAECRDCWARFYCSGGCHANAEAHNGTIDKPYALGCALTKKRLEMAIWLQVQRAVEQAG